MALALCLPVRKAFSPAPSSRIHNPTALLKMSSAAVAMPTARAQAKTGLLSGAPKTCTYRRSTLTRAPRKRTFIANMEKYSRGIETGAVPLAHSYASVSGLLETCPGGNDNNNGNMGGNNSGNNNNNNNDWSSFFGGDWESTPFTLPRTLLLGLMAVFFAMTFMPNQAVASASATASISAAGMPARRQAVKVAAPTSPKAAASTKASATVPPASTEAAQIVYGQVHLTELERKLLAADSRQMFFRETLRSEAIRI